MFRTMNDFLFDFYMSFAYHFIHTNFLSLRIWFSISNQCVSCLHLSFSLQFSRNKLRAQTAKKNCVFWICCGSCNNKINLPLNSMLLHIVVTCITSENQRNQFKLNLKWRIFGGLLFAPLFWWILHFDLVFHSFAEIPFSKECSLLLLLLFFSMWWDTSIGIILQWYAIIIDCCPIQRKIHTLFIWWKSFFVLFFSFQFLSMIRNVF